MLGQLAHAGTGAFDLLLDGEKCKEAMEVPDRTAAGLGTAGLYVEGGMSPSDAASSIGGGASGMTPAWASGSKPIMSISTYNTCLLPAASSASPSYGAFSPTAAQMSGGMTPSGAFSPAYSDVSAHHSLLFIDQLCLCRLVVHSRQRTLPRTVLISCRLVRLADIRPRHLRTALAVRHRLHTALRRQVR